VARLDDVEAGPRVRALGRASFLDHVIASGTAAGWLVGCDQARLPIPREWHYIGVRDADDLSGLAPSHIDHAKRRVGGRPVDGGDGLGTVHTPTPRAAPALDAAIYKADPLPLGVR